MRTTVCINCGYVVKDPLHKLVCPKCRKTFKSDEEIHVEALEIIDLIKHSGHINEIYSLLREDKQREAYKLTHQISGCGITEGCNALSIIRTNMLEYGEVINNTNNSVGLKSDQTSNEFNSKEADITYLTACPVCNGKLSTRATACPHCGNPTGVHVCPKCGSTNTKTISGVSKAASIYLWGPFAANKVVSKFQCKDCGHKF